MACRFSQLVIDCHDHDLVGRFWAGVLGYEESERSDGPDESYVELTGPAGSGWARHAWTSGRASSPGSCSRTLRATSSASFAPQ